MLRRAAGFTTAILAAAVMVQASPASAATTVSVTVLPGLGGDTSASAINDSGLVVGQSNSAAGYGSGHAVVWSGGVLRDINPSGAPVSSAADVNASGQVVVNSGRLNQPSFGDSYIWKNGTLTKTEPFNASYTWASHINSAGQVTLAHTALPAGQSGLLSLGRWSGGFVVDVAYPNGFTCCSSSGLTGINSSGQVIWNIVSNPIVSAASANLWNGLWNTTLSGPAAGYYAATSLNDSGQVTLWGTGHSYVWKSGSATDLGSLGGGGTTASKINSTGQVVGNSNTASGATHAYSWKAGVMSDLGTLPGLPNSGAVSVNDIGQVIGTSYDPAVQNSSRGFVWQNGVMTALPMPSGAVGASVTAINNKGQIIGQVTGSDGKWVPVLWTVTTA